MIAPRFALAAALFLYLVPSPSPLAAQTGTIAGIVRSGASSQPLSNVQISVEGTGLGGLSNNEGRILILQVPAGEHTVIAQLIARQRGLCFPTGRRYMYSNTSYFLLALIVERDANLSFGEFLEARVFEPLGMKHSAVVNDLRVPVLNRVQGSIKCGRAPKSDR